MLSLKQYRDKAKGLPDLLNYAAVIDNGIILNKNGSLMAGFFYRGADLSSSTNNERNMVSSKINAALARLGSGWLTHHDAVRLPAREYPDSRKSFFPDAITKLIDAERREQFKAEGIHYETIYVFTVTYLPPMRRNSKIADIMYDDDQPQKNLGDRLLNQFKEAIRALEDSLSALLNIRRMEEVSYVDEYGQTHTNDQLLEYINFAISGDYHPVCLPPCPMYIDSIVGAHDFWTGVIPKLGEKYISVVAIDGFPMESYPGILAALDQIPIQYRWSNRFIYMDPIESVHHLKKYRRKWKQKVRGFADQLFRTQKGVVDQDAMSMVREAEDAIAEANSNLVIYGYYTSVIILMDSDRKQLQENATEIRRIVQNMGFSARIETINNVEAFLGSLPGHAIQNLRRPMISTMTLADFLPLASIWTGHEFCPCPAYPPSSPALLHAATEGATPFRLNLHVGDLGHTLIFGPTGAGKSTLLALIIAQFRRYKNATIFAFDKGNSLYALTHACGGTHYEIAGDSNNSPSFCPLADIQSQQDQAWAEGWIEIMLELQSIQVTPKQRNEIHRAMNLLLNSDVRTLTDFGTNLQDEGLRQALETYTVSGATGYLLDSADDDLQFGSYQVFEIEHLMNLGEKTLIPVLLYIFHCIEKRLKGQPALLVLDEAWLMLGHPVFREKIREWLKVLRKSNCAVVLATQSLSDAVRSGILDVLQESCPTKILLPNEEAFNRGSGDVLGPKDLYEIIGLNEKQIEIIAGATKKRQYYYVSPEGRRLFELDLGPVALSFVGASGKQDLSIIRKLKDCFKEEWPWHWLRKRGVDFEKYF